MTEKAGEGRNIEVARRLGYHIYHYDKDYAERCYYQLWEPDGMVFGLDHEHKTEAEAWQDAPKWDQDLDLALQLVADVGDFCVQRGNNCWMCGAAKIAVKIVDNLEHLPGAIVDWWLEHVDVKALEKTRKVTALKEKIAGLQDELAELESAE